MVSLDYSIIPAVFIFIAVIIALNFLLFKPLMRVQAEREERTMGVLEASRRNLDYHLDLFNRYQATLKATRLEGYKLQEHHRSEAMKKRAEALAKARDAAEQLVQESRASLHAQVENAKVRIGEEAREIAKRIAETVLQRPA